MTNNTSRSPIIFKTSHRAKFEEIDPFGHLNVNHYLSYFSENRFEGQRKMLGFFIKDLSKIPIAFHTIKIELEFKSPIFLDNEFHISSSIAELGTTSCNIESEMSNDQGVVCSTAKFKMVCIDKKTMKPCPWPQDFIEKFFID